MTDLTFTAIDVETANSDPASVCQVGIVTIRDGQIEECISEFVNPETEFSEVNVGIHGIDDSTVRGAATLPEIDDLLRRSLAGQVVVSHTQFDKNAVARALIKYGLPSIEATWLDSSLVARRAWPRKFRKKWNLALVARSLGIEFRHHDAAEDARAAAEIVLRSCHESGLGIGELVALLSPNSS